MAYVELHAGVLSVSVEEVFIGIVRRTALSSHVTYTSSVRNDLIWRPF